MKPSMRLLLACQGPQSPRPVSRGVNADEIIHGYQGGCLDYDQPDDAKVDPETSEPQYRQLELRGL